MASTTDSAALVSIRNLHKNYGEHVKVLQGLDIDMKPGERVVVIGPSGGGIRVGGTVEMAGLDAAPDYRRSRITVKRAREALPNLTCRDFTEWMGHRPAFPDTMPVMSASAKVPGVFYATGHGHLGMTYGATTARLMGDLITGATPPIDMNPYRIDRF